MGLPIQTIVGGNAAATAGSLPASIRAGATSELIVSELHGNYYEPAVRKTLFSGSNIAAVTTSAGFATTYAGFCLSNPIGSTVNLVVDKIKYAPFVAQTTALILGLQTGFHAATNVAHTTPLVPSSNFVGQPAGVGLIDAAAVLPIAPTRLILLDTLLTGAITTQTIGGKVLDMQGSLIVPPGGFVAFYTSAASVATSLVFGMTWEEVSTTI